MPIQIKRSAYDQSVARLRSQFTDPRALHDAIEAFNRAPDGGQQWEVVPDPTYATALQEEATNLAKYRAAKDIPAGERLDAVLARLAAIHATKMDEAAAWTTPLRPGSHGRQLTPADVNSVAVLPLASALLTEALADVDA